MASLPSSVVDHLAHECGAFANHTDRTALGTVRGEGALTFSETQHAFWLAGEPCPLSLVRALDARGLVAWRFLEHRDWMRRLDEAACDAAYEEVLEQIAGSKTGAAALDEQIRRHVRKNDSYLYGRIVETDEPDGAHGRHDGAVDGSGDAPAAAGAPVEGAAADGDAPAPSAEAVAAAAALAAESGPGLSAPKAEHMTKEDIRRHKRKQRAAQRADQKAAREKRKQQDLANNEPKKPRSFKSILPKPKKGDQPADNGPIER